ncbi:MAG TPA: AAA family ATPase, partial [Kofleriaceae bacterium]
VIHRDVKPSNLILTDGEWSRAKLVDFGIAHMADATMLTATGGRPGTPAYMSPEQAGRQSLTPATDVFSLGLVFFECLTGRRCFDDADLFQVLARIIIDDPPRASELREGVPPALDDLIARMTAKDPRARPAASEVADQLVGLVGSSGGGDATPTITRAERKLLAVVVARAAEPADPAARDSSSATVVDPLGPSAPLVALGRQLGARLDALRDGSVMAVISDAGGPAELSSRAAHLAIQMQAHLGEVPIAVATGRAAGGKREWVAELIARAGALVGRHTPGICLDEVTAALVSARFRVEDGMLRGERGAIDPAIVVGRKTAFVGRDRELGVMRGVFDECRHESIPHAVLVIGEAGIGKSRIGHELLAGLREDEVPFELLVAAGDPIGAAPFGLLARLTQAAAGIHESEGPEIRRAKVAEQVRRCVGAEDRARVAAYLAELVGGGRSPAESAGGGDPMRLGDRIRIAWQDWLAAMAAERPVIVLLDDLHWGDLASVKVVDLALRNLSDRPLMVLALARPEVVERFPDLWAGREIQELRLGGLRPRACTAMVREVLGDGLPEAEVKRLIERTDGNPFFLEEIIRSLERGEREVPESVLATVQFGLDQVPDEARRVLRAASVFGTRFWDGGVQALLGGRLDGLDEWLEVLVARELVQRLPESTYQGQRELVFRHALVRDAAYSSLVSEDLALGHRLAGDWLERVGASDPVVLAEHFRLGGAPARASLWYLRAAERALQGDDLSLVLHHVERARACEPDPDTDALLDLFEAQARHWRREMVKGERAALRAIGGLEPGSSAWFEAAWLAMACGIHCSGSDELHQLISRVQATVAGQGAVAHRLKALFAGAEFLYLRSEQAAGDALVAVPKGMLDELADPPAIASAAYHAAIRARAVHAGEPEEALAASRAAVDAYLAAGDIRGAAFALGNAGWSYMILGALAESAEASSESLRLQGSAGGSDESTLANLGLVLARLGRSGEAARRLRAQIDALSHDAAAVATLQQALAFVQARGDSLAEAEELARAAAAAQESLAPACAEALVVLAEILFSAGRPAEALDGVERAYTLVDPLLEHDG